MSQQTHDIKSTLDRPPVFAGVISYSVTLSRALMKIHVRGIRHYHAVLHGAVLTSLSIPISYTDRYTRGNHRTHLLFKQFTQLSRYFYQIKISHFCAKFSRPTQYVYCCFRKWISLELYQLVIIKNDKRKPNPAWVMLFFKYFPHIYSDRKSVFLRLLRHERPV